MKLFLALITLISFQAVAEEIVAITDTNFVKALIAEGVDANKDGKIQVSEAEAITKLYVGVSEITNLTGIQAFVNLIELNCQENSITKLDVSNLLKLEKLECQENELMSLDVSKNTKLNYLNCSGNYIDDVYLKHNPNLETLACRSLEIIELDLSFNLMLKFLDCSDNDLKNLNISKNVLLEKMYCYQTQLEVLNVSHLKNLEILVCNESKLTFICVSSLEQFQNKFLLKDEQTKIGVCENGLLPVVESVFDAVELVKVYNLQGIEVPEDTQGEMLIFVYSNGKVEKVINE